MPRPVKSVSLPVRNREEAEAVAKAWEQPDIRAFVFIAGMLLPLTPRARARVIKYVEDRVLDPDFAKAVTESPEPAAE